MLDSKVGGGEKGKGDMARVTECDLREAYQRLVRRPVWQGQEHLLENGGD